VLGLLHVILSAGLGHIEESSRRIF